jgi:hypothetical protein
MRNRPWRTPRGRAPSPLQLPSRDGVRDERDEDSDVSMSKHEARNNEYSYGDDHTDNIINYLFGVTFAT